VNERLRDFAARSAGNTTLVDVAELIPFHQRTKEWRNTYWDDGLAFPIRVACPVPADNIISPVPGLHFSPAGYDLMGTKIFERMESPLKPKRK